ncbi:MAG: DUF1840 domain-containing protein [Burkholderiaceae bacterium]|nr:MAG: DUF1840 domain-containing protein [Burkholderiaceae bacterium]
MLITFDSKASARVMMFGDVAQQLLQLIGKTPDQKGVITVEQLPEAIGRLRHVAAVSKAQRGEENEGGDGQTRGRSTVSLAQRAAPLLELLESSLKAQEPVVWGV